MQPKRARERQGGKEAGQTGQYSDVNTQNSAAEGRRVASSVGHEGEECQRET